MVQVHVATSRPFDSARDVDARVPLMHEGAVPQVGVYRSRAGFPDRQPHAGSLGNGPGAPILRFSPTVGKAKHAVAPESECKGLTALDDDLAGTHRVPDHDRCYVGRGRHELLHQSNCVGDVGEGNCVPVDHELNAVGANDGRAALEHASPSKWCRDRDVGQIDIVALRQAPDCCKCLVVKLRAVVDGGGHRLD